ncbi:hypothetical protein BDQ17DRAFT_1434570 [Cyathus striatus]|nr:hypothetical protein BDQ17DRAFT_1434570 [Cyathus striatus]
MRVLILAPCILRPTPSPSVTDSIFIYIPYVHQHTRVNTSYRKTPTNFLASISLSATLKLERFTNPDGQYRYIGGEGTRDDFVRAREVERCFNEGYSISTSPPPQLHPPAHLIYLRPASAISRFLILRLLLSSAIVAPGENFDGKSAFLPQQQACAMRAELPRQNLVEPVLEPPPPPVQPPQGAVRPPPSPSPLRSTSVPGGMGRWIRNFLQRGLYPGPTSTPTAPGARPRSRCYSGWINSMDAEGVAPVQSQEESTLHAAAQSYDIEQELLGIESLTTPPTHIHTSSLSRLRIRCSVVNYPALRIFVHAPSSTTLITTSGSQIGSTEFADVFCAYDTDVAVEYYDTGGSCMLDVSPSPFPAHVTSVTSSPLTSAELAIQTPPPLPLCLANPLSNDRPLAPSVSWAHLDRPCGSLAHVVSPSGSSCRGPWRVIRVDDGI